MTTKFAKHTQHTYIYILQLMLIGGYNCGHAGVEFHQGYWRSRLLMRIVHRINTLRPRQNCHHFANDIFKCIFLNENVWPSLKISLKFVPEVRINNIPALIQAPSHYLNQLEQLERLRSEDTPRSPMITHTIDQFILNPMSVLLTSLYRIPSQNKVKAEKL